MEIRLEIKSVNGNVAKVQMVGVRALQVWEVTKPYRNRVIIGASDPVMVMMATLEEWWKEGKARAVG